MQTHAIIIHNKSIIWLIHKLRSTSIKVYILCQILTKVTSAPTVKQEAMAVSATFTKAFELFAKYHEGYNANSVTDSTMKQTGEQLTQSVT